MRETTLQCPNRDWILVQATGQGWQVTYYRATSLKSHWMRRLLGAPPVFRVQAHTGAEVQALLLRRGVNLEPAEAQQLEALLSQPVAVQWPMQLAR